jgi:hypothetical protein
MNRSTQHAFEPEEIMAYLDGELEARQAAALASHLDHCPQCQTVAAQLRLVSDRLLDFQIELSPAGLGGKVFEAPWPEDRAKSTLLEASTRPTRRIGRTFVWVFASVLLAFVITASLIPLYRLRTHGNFDSYMGKHQEGISVDNALVHKPRPGLTLPAAPPPLNGRSITGLVTLASPGAAADSNGLYHGLGDLAKNSFNVDGQIVTDQQSKAFSNRLMIVQTASITILAANYDQSSGAIQSLAAKHSGYVQDITANSQTGSARSLSATLRVPETQLEALLADLRKLGHVEQETHNNQEITDQYVDLTARLKTSRAAEQRILELLKTRTGNLSEVLQAEEELARIRGEIESMDGQRANMEHQVRYATVQVQLNEEYREQLNPESFSTGRRLRNSVVEGLANLAGGITGAAIFAFAYGPSIIFWLALLAVPAWFIWRRFKRPKSA